MGPGAHGATTVGAAPAAPPAAGGSGGHGGPSGPAGDHGPQVGSHPGHPDHLAHPDHQGPVSAPARGRRRPGPSPDATRTALLDAAEVLFGERGINGVSLREIAERAGQRNNAAVQYHFGGRAELVQALFARRSIHLDARTRAMLADLDAAGRGDDLEGLVRALIEPFTEVMDSGHTGHWVRLVAEMNRDPRFSPFAPSGHDHRPYTEDTAATGAFLELVRRIQVVLGLDRAETVNRFFLLQSLVVHTVADREALAARGAAGELDPPEVLAERLVRAAVAVLR